MALTRGVQACRSRCGCFVAEPRDGGLLLVDVEHVADFHLQGVRRVPFVDGVSVRAGLWSEVPGLWTQSGPAGVVAAAKPCLAVPTVVQALPACARASPPVCLFDTCLDPLVFVPAVPKNDMPPHVVLVCGDGAPRPILLARLEATEWRAVPARDPTRTPPTTTSPTDVSARSAKT